LVLHALAHAGVLFALRGLVEAGSLSLALLAFVKAVTALGYFGLVKRVEAGHVIICALCHVELAL